MESKLEAIKCNSCAAPVPAGTGIREFTCVYCGKTDCVNSNLQNRIRRFYELIQQLENAAKQIPTHLKSKIERMLGQVKITEWALLITAGWMLFISLFIFYEYFLRAMTDGTVPKLRFIFGPLLPFEIFIGLILWYFFILRRKKKIRLTFRARPPVLPNGPARCRLCGGDLPDSGVIRRCPYCETDSIVPKDEFAGFEENLLQEIEVVESGISKQLLKKIRACENAYDYFPVYLVGLIGALLLLTTIANMTVTALAFWESSGSTGVLQALVPGVISLAIIGVIFFALIIPRQLKLIKTNQENRS